MPRAFGVKYLILGMAKVCARSVAPTPLRYGRQNALAGLEVRPNCSHRDKRRLRTPGLKNEILLLRALNLQTKKPSHPFERNDATTERDVHNKNNFLNKVASHFLILTAGCGMSCPTLHSKI